MFSQFYVRQLLPCLKIFLITESLKFGLDLKNDLNPVIRPFGHSEPVLFKIPSIFCAVISNKGERPWNIGIVLNNRWSIPIALNGLGENGYENSHSRVTETSGGTCYLISTPKFHHTSLLINLENSTLLLPHHIITRSLN
jgi:hypothetical protein